MKKDTIKKPAVKTLDVGALAQVRGGSLNTYFSTVKGQKQGQFKGG
jgi:hypothetical protein